MRLVLLCSLLPLLAFAQEPSELPDREAGYQNVERFIKILEEVRANHPDADKVSYERLVNFALEGMLDSLDPFSAFYHPETATAFDPDAPQDEPQFTIASLGLTLGKRDGVLYLARVREGSSAAEAGFLNGDLLRRKGERDLSQMELPIAMAALSGAPGSEITLTVYRKTLRQEVTHPMRHRVVKQEALADAFLLEKTDSAQVGYVRLTEFTALSPRELEAALDDLEDKGIQSLILDLRGNPGGLLTASVDILGLFLPPRTEVVTTQGRSPRAQTEPLKTPERQRVKREYPLAVLIDRNSASASELVSGALQDLERATIVGEVSYGKGSVQNIESRSGGTALRLTFATYHTPSGKTPHLVGITPDVLVETSETDRANFERFKLRKNAPVELQEELKAWTDPVLQAAVEALK